MDKVTGQTNLLELVERHPELKRVFEGHGISWLDVTCINRTDNLLEDAAAMCGLIPDDLLNDLNQALQELESQSHQFGR